MTPVLRNDALNICLVILAAGSGSRYGGLKQLAVVGPAGEAILDYSIDDAVNAGFSKVVLVVRWEILGEVRAHVDSRFSRAVEVEYAIQETGAFDGNLVSTKPAGTAHAVLSARSLVSTPFAVINADDYYGASAFEQMASFLHSSSDEHHFAMIAYRLGKTLSENGAVSRAVCKLDNNRQLTSVSEQHGISRQAKGLADNTLVSMNFWGFQPVLFDTLQREYEVYLQQQGYKHGEFLLPEVINTMISRQALRVSVIPSEEQWYGITYAADREVVRSALRHRPLIKV